MDTILVEIRTGAYYDSVILMQLQRSLSEQPGMIDAGVIMGTDANKDILIQSGLMAPEVDKAKPDDMVIVVKAEDLDSAQSALRKVDELLIARRQTGLETEYLPKSIETAAQILPEAQWVLISVPGRYAAGVTRQALDSGRHVFLYSDNVSLEDEIELKEFASSKGLLVMGPDCGTAIINGIGLGFANKVRRGPVGMVAAAGTGLQQVSSRIHQMGGGFTHAIGTGGRDLSERVNAITTRQGIDLLSRDPDTHVIVLVSKPPEQKVANQLIEAVSNINKPVVVNFIGYPTKLRQVGNITFTTTFDETAASAVDLLDSQVVTASEIETITQKFQPSQRYLRGLFSGGTLAFEALLILQGMNIKVYSNAPLDKNDRLADSLVSQENTIIDLGEDEFTVGRLHPMMDNDLRIRRLYAEANDPEVAIILLDVVLGFGAHPDPAGELAPAIKKAAETASRSGRHLEIFAVVCGTDEDPQDISDQKEKLIQAGARVETSNDATVRYIGKLLRNLNPHLYQQIKTEIPSPDLSVLRQPFAAINVGLESFTNSLQTQGARVIQLDWKPAAGGNEKLANILNRMKSKS